MSEALQTLQSSVPGVYTAFVKLVKEACERQEQQTGFFDFAVTNYQPGRYVLLTGFAGPKWEWESIGVFEQKEHFMVMGRVVVYSGSNPAEGGDNPISLQVMQEAFTLLQEAVFMPVFSNRNMPILGTEGPTPYLVLPGEARHEAGPGMVDGASAGWESVINFSFNFSSILTPEPATE